MSINIVNNNKSLTKIASNTNLNKRMRGNYLGKIDTLFNGSFTGTGNMQLKYSVYDYDFIEIEFGNQKFNTISFDYNELFYSSSSYPLRFYVDDSTCFSFVAHSNYIEIVQNNLNIRKITGFKMETITAHLNNLTRGKEYSNNVIFTDSVWVSDIAVFRKVIDYKLESVWSSSNYIYHNLSTTDVVEINSFAITPNGEVYILPYINENGKSTSINVENERFYIMIKGISWPIGTIFRVVIDFTKY